MFRVVQYHIRKNDHLYGEINNIALRIRTLREMVERDKTITKREWEEFLFSSAEIQGMLKNWTAKVVMCKEKYNDDLIKPEEEGEQE